MTVDNYQLSVNNYQLTIIRKFAVSLILIFLSMSQGGCTSVALSPVIFFQNYISPADGSRCPMYPTCSAYSVEAINRHGALPGLIMTFDRLMRCGRDELKLSGTIQIKDNHYCNDPVSNNDFWWPALNQNRDYPDVINDGHDVIEGK